MCPTLVIIAHLSKNLHRVRLKYPRHYTYDGTELAVSRHVLSKGQKRLQQNLQIKDRKIKGDYTAQIKEINLCQMLVWFRTDFRKHGLREKGLGFGDLRKLLRILFVKHKTNGLERSTINFLEGPTEPLLAMVKRQELAWFGHVTRHEILSQTILQGILEGGRRRGRQRKCWMDNIKEWTCLHAHARTAHDGLPHKRLEEGLG